MIIIKYKLNNDVVHDFYIHNDYRFNTDDEVVTILKNYSNSKIEALVAGRFWGNTVDVIKIYAA